MKTSTMKRSKILFFVSVAGFCVITMLAWCSLFSRVSVSRRQKEQQQHQRQSQSQQDSHFPRRRRLSSSRTVHNNTTTTTGTNNNDDSTIKKKLQLFEVSNDYTVLGPSAFPKPSTKLHKDALPLLQPSYGQHRPDQDVVMAFAAEYGLNTYLVFCNTLRRTGYTGDIVLAVSQLDIRGHKNKNVVKFFETTPGLVVYVLDLKCLNAEGEAVESIKGGMRVCQLPGLYGRETTATTNDGGIIRTQVDDPRPPRTVATTRYELYWIWSLHYNKHSWIMLVDARDTVFQSNPFAHVPREEDEASSNRPDGILYFFGENTDAVRIGKSQANRKWITTAYGKHVMAALQDKPTICSGSTMGEQVAVETYLRAMVAESDETGTKLMGADQGFHNYLYYSNKLANAHTIRGIVVFDQGRGIINNLGAMRTKELNEWGNIVREQQRQQDANSSSGTTTVDLTVLNWDGIPSPVVHQFDRHPVLSKYVYDTVATRCRHEFFDTLKKTND